MYCLDSCVLIHVSVCYIANFEALGLGGAVFTSGKSGKMPYGQIKKYFRNTDAVINPGTTSTSGKKTEDLQFYYHPDHLGSSSYITDVSGEVYQHMEYFPFGETFVEERNDAEYTNYLYNGKELDEETGLYYYGARYYDPRVSLWQSVDPLADKYPSFSPYNYALNNPINLIDPNGNAVTGPPKETKVGKFIRNNLPGLIASPLGGLTDAFAGIGRLTGSIFNGGKTSNQAGKDLLGGMLSIFGMKEILMERSSSQTPTSASKLPNSLNNEMKEMQEKAWTELKMSPADNGMHAWHAGSNAALSNKLGPIGGLMAWLGGIYHETPFDKASFGAEQAAQGTLNHILDSFTDIAANTMGMTIGLLLPKKPAKWLSLRIGNLIPGPGDPDPNGTGGGGYTGKPSIAWFNWWKNGFKSDNPNYNP